MGRNLEKDAVEMAAKNQRILENGFRIFAERNIENVKMTEVANAAGISIASLYRYYSTKSKLVIAISTWIWTEYSREYRRMVQEARGAVSTAAEDFGYYLESFLDLYRNHRAILRFNQFFNVYMQSEAVSDEDKEPYMKMIKSIENRFKALYQKGQRDGTLKTDMPAEKVFSVTIHLMLAVVTRFAVGLVYNVDADAEEELRLQKELLMKRFCVSGQ